jgi:hypothetical protein
MTKLALIVAALFLLGLIAGCDTAEEQTQPMSVAGESSIDSPVKNESEIPETGTTLSTGQMVFVPAYSSIRVGKKGDDLSASHVSIRNTSTSESITLRYVDLYGDNGDLLRNYIEDETQIPPMGSRLFVVRQDEKLGGAGSNYLIEWTSKNSVTPPFIESVTYRYAGTKAMAFTSPSTVLRQIDATPAAEELLF